MDKYQIIRDEEKFLEFIDWLSELKDNEKFYCCLFARKKYCPDEVKSSDKSQLKRFLTTKERMLEKVRQLEVPMGAYRLKDQMAPQVSLAFYINPNPRDLRKATFDSIINLTQLLKNNRNYLNPHAEVMSCIQQSASKKEYLDFDIDDKEFDLRQLEEIINPSCLTVVQTRGGYHVLVKIADIAPIYKKSFFQSFTAFDAVDQSGDQLLPVPGCTQGGYVPKFVDLTF